MAVSGDEEKIEKIINIEELVNNVNHDTSKEGILIDFNDEFINSIPSQPLSINNDLSGINFESTNDLFDMASLYQDNQIVCPENDKIEIEKISKSFDEVKLDSFIGASSRKDMYSKYYAPPIDSCEGQYGKSRYYSSVCSNCDFTNEFTCNSFSIGENMCKCCGEYYSYNNPCMNVYLPPNETTCNDNCSSTICNVESTLYPTYQCKNESFTTNFTNNTNKQTFQSQICKEFIEELENNFSSINNVKLKDSSNGYKPNPVYPVINPPPRSFKTRRPAPPPPIQKKTGI